MARSTYGLSHDEFKKAQNAVKTDELINKHEEVALLDDIPLPIKAIGAAMALPAAVKEGLKILQRKFEKGPLLDNTYNKQQLQSNAKNNNQSDRVTPAQLKLIQDSRGVQSPYEVKEAIDPLDPAKGIKKASLENPNMDILLPYVVDPEDAYSRPSEDPEMRERGWNLAHQTHTDNPQWSGEHDPKDHILYDESGNPVLMETPDGLVPYKEQLMSHNYRSGPPTDGIKDIIIERANELMKIGEQDKALELMKIVPGLLQQV